MKSAYQLSPIPPFRAQPSKTTASSIFASSPATAVSRESLEAADTSSQLTSFSFNKKRPPPLKRYSRSNLSSIDPDEGPDGTQKMISDYSRVSPRSGSRPLSPLSTAQGGDTHRAHIQPRVQPGRPGHYAPAIHRPSMSASKSCRGSISTPGVDANLTPPATPNSREAIFVQPKSTVFISKSINANLPPTPNTSPFQKVSPLLPTTVSAKALSAHKLHPIFAANYALGDELGSGGFGFVVQATRLADSMQCAVKFIYKEKIPQQAWVRDERWEDDNDKNGIQRTTDGIKRVPLEAVSFLPSILTLISHY